MCSLAQSISEVKSLAPEVQGFAILLIEDNPDHQLLERRALQVLGDQSRVVVVGTAVEGLAALEQQTFDLVVADYRMPGMDGLEFLYTLNERGVNVPVVIVTGLGDEKVAVRALKEGAYDYVIKESGYLELLPSIAGRAISAFRTQQQLEVARRRLADSEERYRELVHGIDAIVWEANPDTREFTFVSQRAETILGYPVDRWLNNPDFYINLVHPDDSEKVAGCWAKAIAERRDQVFEFRAMASDGKTVWLRNLVRIFGDNNKIAKVRGLMVDITERMRMELELLNAQKLESVGLLAGGIAHDFNNILTAIHGYSQMVQDQLGDAHQSSADIERIKEAVGRAASLTHQLLAFSRKQVLQPRILDLNAVITGLEKMLRRIIGEDISIIARLALDLARIRADPGQIEQVLMNLAVNARDAMPQGGKLIIETAAAFLDEACVRRHIGVEPGNYVMMAVTDTGCGMSPALQARVFEPFFTTKELGKGTGLGLSTVYGIVKQSGGDIWIYSEPGKGTTFRIYFPRVDEAAEQSPSEEHAGRVLKGTESILLVEDDEAVRELACTLLKRCGYTVLPAATPEEAMQLCSDDSIPIRLLLTDIVLPGQSGRDLSRCIIKLRPAIKILFMSGYTNDALIHQDESNGQFAFLQKPFTLETLTRSVRDSLDSAQP
jgi:hypothetical protein